MRDTTVGQMLVNAALPDELRDYDRVLDKKGMHKLLEQVAREHPDSYREISFKLSQVGQRAAQDEGGMSFGIRHLRRSKVADATRQKITANLSKILDDDSLTDEQRADRIVHLVGKEMEPQQKAILEEAIKDKNPLAMQVLSGSRGKPMNLASLLGGDMLYSDHRDEVIPIPVLRSYSEGLSPEEYWAGTYGARRGIIATKFATQEAGFLSKQLNQAGHRLVVEDEEGDDDHGRGMIVDTDDMDNEGSLLAQDMGPYKRNTPLTPKILKHLKRLGKGRILIRSPLVGGSPAGGVYARDVGIRETGKLPGRGEQVGLQAAQALSEPISQGQLSAKHSGGVAGQEKAVGGFHQINQLIQVPKKMQGGAAHAEQDGTVQRIEEAPAGGYHVTINDQQHYVGDGYKVKVKKGDEIEAGDLISDGIPNPALIVKHKGVGEGRRYFVNEFRNAMASSGMRGHRRNIELLARGLINHVKLTEETDDHAPDDIVPYSTLEHTYKPRTGHEVLTPKKAVGQYLERPVLHYTIGTKIRPSMLKDFKEFGIAELPVHKNPPPFEPHMVRGMYQLQHDPDWMTQMYGSGLKKSLLESTARGATSESRGTSFIPSLASGENFGGDPERSVIKPQTAYELPKIEPPEEPKPVAEITAPAAPSFFGGRFKMGMHKEAVAAPKATAPTPAKLPTPPTPAAPKAPATAPLAAPLAPTPAPSGTLDMSPNIMGATNQQSAPAPVAPTPPPVTTAQARTDQMQRSNAQVSANPMQDMQTLFGGGQARQLATSSMSGSADRRKSREMGLLAARQRTQQMQLQQGAQQNMQMQAPQSYSQSPLGDSVQNPLGVPGAEQPQGGGITAGAAVDGLLRDQHAWVNTGKAWGAAGKGNMLSQGTRMGNALNAPAQAGVKTVNQLARTAAHNTPGIGRFVAATADDAAAATARGAGMAGAKGLSKFLGPVGSILEGGFIGKDLYDKTQQGQSFGEAWKQQADDHATRSRGLLTDWSGGAHEIYQKPLDVLSHVLSPVATVQAASQLQLELAGGAKDLAAAGAGKVRDLATWSTPQSRAAANDKKLTQEIYTQDRRKLSEQKEQIQSQLQNTSTPPEQQAQLQAQLTETDAKIQDSIAKSRTMEDETANWQLGKQNVFGGGHHFRDAMDATGRGIGDKIKELEGNYGNLDHKQTVELKNMKLRQGEIKRLSKLYSEEVGYFGEGNFRNTIKQSVRGAGRQLIELQRQMRDPATRDNPNMMRELQADVQHHEQRIRNLQDWAGQAENH